MVMPNNLGAIRFIQLGGADCYVCTNRLNNFRIGHELFSIHHTQSVIIKRFFPSNVGLSTSAMQNKRMKNVGILSMVLQNKLPAFG
jgi:hypothetical protein